jgi:hypothetical protein
MAAAQNIPGAKVVYEGLKTRFPGGKRKTGETKTEIIKKEVTVSQRLFGVKNFVLELTARKTVFLTRNSEL